MIFSRLRALIPSESRRAYARTLIDTAKVCVPILVDGFRGTGTRERADRGLRTWAKNAARHSKTTIEVLGLEHISPGETYVVMSNHQSNFDILSIYYAYPGCLRMVAKKEMKRAPLLGRAMEASEFIFIDRGNNAKARQALDEAALRIRSGVSVWIAPEGTRSQTGELGKFKKGGFMLALSADVKILPCTLNGTRDVLPIGASKLTLNQTVTVQFHPPIDAPAYGIEKRESLMLDVRAAIANGLTS